MRQNMLLACVGKVVRSTIFCCSRVRGSFVFIAAFVFPGGSAESSCTSASASVRGLRSPAFFCVRLCSCAYACLELVLVACAVSGLLLSTCTWIPRLCCSAVLHSSIVSRLFLLPHLRLTCLWAGCGWHVAVVKAVSVV